MEGVDTRGRGLLLRLVQYVNCMFDILTWAQQLYSKKVKQGLKICGAFYQNEFELIPNDLFYFLFNNKQQPKFQVSIKDTMH